MLPDSVSLKEISMICFDTKQGRFSLRSVAVAIFDEHILISRASEDNFWALPGGRVELFESSSEAIVREMLEELGLQCRVQRHLWHVENFFTFRSIRFHELANYFLVTFSDQPQIDSEVDFKGIETAEELIFRWVPLKNLEFYNLKPDFLVKKLNNLPSSAEFFSIDETKV